MEVEVGTGTGTGTNQRSRTRMDAFSFTGQNLSLSGQLPTGPKRGERHQGIVLSFRNWGLRSA